MTIPAIAIKPVNIGAVSDDGTGDKLRLAFEKLNSNVASLSEVLAAVLAGADPNIVTFKSIADLIYAFNATVTALPAPAVVQQQITDAIASTIAAINAATAAAIAGVPTATTIQQQITTAINGVLTSYYSKTDIDGIIAALKGSADAAHDTLGELQALVDANTAAIPGKASNSETATGTDTAKYTTPAGVNGAIKAIALLISNSFSEIAAAGATAQASARANIGMVKATTAQAQAGTDDATYTTPAGVAAAIKALALSGPAGARTVSAADTIVATDKGKVLNLAGSFTLGATAAATLGAGFFCYLRKRDGSGVVIFDPNAAETIDARTAINVYQESFLIWTDGTAWFSQGRPKGWVPVATVALTNQSLASLSITDGFLDPEIGEVEFKFENLNFASSTTTAYRPIKNGAIQTNTNVVVETINTATTTASGTSTNSATGGVGLTLTASTGPVSGQIKARNTLSAVAADTRVDFDAMQIGATRRGWTYESTAAQLGGFALVPGANLTSISYTVKGYRP